jgi:hypothetical protein
MNPENLMEFTEDEKLSIKLMLERINSHIDESRRLTDALGGSFARKEDDFINKIMPSAGLEAGIRIFFSKLSDIDIYSQLVIIHGVYRMLLASMRCTYASMIGEVDELFEKAHEDLSKEEQMRKVTKLLNRTLEDMCDRRAKEGLSEKQAVKEYKEQSVLIVDNFLKTV